MSDCLTHHNTLLTLHTGSTSDGSTASGLPITVIAGGAGGAVLFVTILLCVIIIFCVKRSRKSKSYAVNMTFINDDEEFVSKDGLLYWKL